MAMTMATTKEYNSDKDNGDNDEEDNYDNGDDDLFEICLLNQVRSTYNKSSIHSSQSVISH